MNGFDQLTKQMLKYPRVKHDDFVDALARVPEVNSGWQFEAPPPTNNGGSWLEKLGVYPKPDDETAGGNDGSQFCM